VDKPFPAYKGNEPFVFVCYSHEDAAVVYPELAWLHDHGVNVWYDEGIPAGENWRANIGRALLDASHVLIYLSRSSLISDHCNREINLALDEGKAVVPVYLEPVELTPDLKVGLNRVQALRLESNANHRTSLLAAIGLTQPTAATESPPAQSSRRWVLSASVLAGLIAFVGLGSWIAFNDDDLPTHSVPANNLYERALRTADELERVDLLEKALEYDPDFLDARADLAFWLASAGERVNQSLPTLQRAQDEALRVLASNPKHAWATVALARTYAQLDLNARKALDTYHEAESLGADPSVVAIYKAAIYLNVGRYDEAESTMLAARERDPDAAYVADFLARSLYMQGKVDAAWAMFDEALELNPRFVNAINLAILSAVAENDVVRLRALIQRIPADALPRWAEPMAASLEGDHEPLRRLFAFYEENREQYKTPAIWFTAGYWWAKEYEKHIRWFEIREREFNTLYFVNSDIAWKPNYWEKLEAWSVADSEQAAYRQQLLRDHQSRIEQITSKMVL